MEGALILGLISLTSVGGYVLGTKIFALPWQGLRMAVSKALEGLGIALVFFVVNVGLGILVILAGRILTGVVLSFYVLDDFTLMALSLFQGLSFQWWRESLPSRLSGGNRDR